VADFFVSFGKVQILSDAESIGGRNSEASQSAIMESTPSANAPVKQPYNALNHC
jgi:hypothetical protein